jgi:hypothetical protein
MVLTCWCAAIPAELLVLASSADHFWTALPLPQAPFCERAGEFARNIAKGSPKEPIEKNESCNFVRQPGPVVPDAGRSVHKPKGPAVVA